MARRYAYSFALAALIAVAASFAYQADAGLFVFTDRDSWQAALGTSNTPYTFNGFVADQSFASNAINFGPFNLRAIGTPPAGTDKVVADSSNGTVNGSPFASMFLDSTRSVELAFTHPALAFGADFLGEAFNFGVFLKGARTPIILAGPTSTPSYFGVISTDPIDRVQFLYSGPEGQSTTVNFDDVGIASAVPEPSSLMILGVAATLLATYGCWRVRHDRVEGSSDHS